LFTHGATMETKMKIHQYLAVSAVLTIGLAGAASAQSFDEFSPSGGKLSCSQAAALIDRRGLHDINPVSCSGTNYEFQAKEGGRDTSVYVNSVTGYVDVPDAESIDNRYRR
jgi:hypothetical protein